ncbi:MAG: DEAD/DEAH box helicase [Planctomycetes bacterium]|nr:DEAD/DEAH box helicase [Planctomycetota bacterium]
MQPLPIDPWIDEIVRQVRDNPITVVEAPPGSGKTTRVAPALMDAFRPACGVLNGSSSAGAGKVYLLQPRRLAARSVAERIANEREANRKNLASSLGETLEPGRDDLSDRGEIGYAVRFDHRITKQTRLVVATEGILIRRLQSDPAIEDVSVVVLDEFHERSIDADLLLAMLRRVQQTLREDLRIVIMSATLDSTFLERALGNVPTIQVSSVCFPVSIRYRPAPTNLGIAEHCAATIGDVVDVTDGDLLAFLPGASEIHRCIDALRGKRLERDFDLIPLYGALSVEDQMLAIERGTRRRIVVATNVAETSITIPGVTVVVDSGLARVLRYSPEVGIDRLELENISAASAAQRAGRAGRTAPGICYRLWSDVSDRSRSAHLEPEIRRVDLAGTLLQLIAWGEGDSDDFPWLEPPRPEAIESGKRLLGLLGAIDHGRITSMGQAMSKLPLHPRLSRICLAAMAVGCLDDASIAVALLSERDPFDRRGGHAGGRSMRTHSVRRWDSDLVERVRILQEMPLRGNVPPDMGESPFGMLTRGGARTIHQVAEQIRTLCTPISEELMKRVGIDDGAVQRKDPAVSEAGRLHDEVLMRVLLSGFPDRLAKRRASGKNQAIMVGGKGVVLAPQSGVHEPELFLCLDIEAGAGDALVRQASRIDAEWLNDKVQGGSDQGGNLQEREDIFFHPTQKQVVARRRTVWIDLVLQETPTSITDESQCQEVLWQAVRVNWEQVFPKDNDDLTQWIARVNCLREWMPEYDFPAINRERLLTVAKDLCRNRCSLSEVRGGAWTDWLGGELTPAQRSVLDKEAPSRIVVPSGSSIRIEYQEGKPPVLAVKIQEVFSWLQTPKIAGGRVPLLLHLLAPSMRAQQITDDLASFWKNGYPEVKKELKRRYPKHSWPDDPLSAPPTKR